MSGRIIQGFFVGGAARVSPFILPAWAQGQTAVAPSRTSVAHPTTTGRARSRPDCSVAQLHGGTEGFEIDPVKVGLARGGGAALPEAVLAKMEAAFNADFSAVRVHVGPQAARIGAIAFTTGNDIYFTPGRYQPNTVQGQQLLGHELAHVVQQRQGRVRAPGSGVTVVQDRMLEAEADRLGMRAAMSCTPLQPKSLPGNGQVRVSAPMPNGNGRYRLDAQMGGRNVGSLMVHLGQGDSALVTDLGVDPTHRSRGIGRMLLASAAQTGLRFGKPRVALTADDNGSGKLSRWYGGLGFARTGSDARGRPMLEAQAGRILSGAAQPKVAAAASRPGFAPIQRAALAVVPTTTKAGGAIAGIAPSGVSNTGGLTATYGRNDVSPSGKHHAEPTLCKLFNDAFDAINKNKKKNAAVKPLPAQIFTMNAWPCRACDALLQRAATRCHTTITVTVTADKGGYAADHGVAAGSLGTITYT